MGCSTSSFMQPSAIPAGPHKAYRGRAGKCKRKCGYITRLSLPDCHNSGQPGCQLTCQGANHLHSSLRQRRKLKGRPPVLLCEPRCNFVRDEEGQEGKRSLLIPSHAGVSSYYVLCCPPPSSDCWTCSCCWWDMAWRPVPVGRTLPRACCTEQ